MSDLETHLVNAFETTLAAALGSADLSGTFASASGLTAPCYLVLDPDSSALREYVLVTDIAGGTVVLTRYLAGSAAPSGLAHAAGATVRMAPMAQHFEDLNDRIDARVTDIASVEAEIVTDHGGLSGLADDDHPQYLTVARHDADDHSGLDRMIVFSVVDLLSVKTGTFRWYPPFAVTIQDVRASVGTAPTGAAAIFDVNRSGTTIFTTQSHRPQIAASSFFGVSGTPDVTAVSTSQYLTVDVDQVGSAVPGADGLILVRYRRA